MADLQELFSRLRSSDKVNDNVNRSTSSTLPARPSNYQPPSVSATILSPPIHTPEPTSSAILSPKIPSPAQDPNAASLLNLLRFNAQQTQQSPMTALKNVSSNKPPHETRSVSSDNRTLLLNLLNQTKKTNDETPTKDNAALETQTESTPSRVLPPAQSTEFTPLSAFEAVQSREKESTPLRVFGSTQSKESTPFEAPRIAAKGSDIFTYVNPFEHLAASTPRNVSPAPVSHKKMRTGSTTKFQPSSEEKIQAETTTVKVSPDTNTEAVTVYNFPMKPFVSIYLQPRTTLPNVNPESIMDIVRLKKDFDQMDRCLATASQTHIVYALAKSGGYRIIRQDSGRDQQAFKNSTERLFNIQVKSYAGHEGTDYILATGVSGSIYWTKLQWTDEEEFIKQRVEDTSFVIKTPISPAEENPSTGTIKSRTKLSSRTPGVFAYSRSKSIFITSADLLSSQTYIDQASRLVNYNQYLDDQTLKISCSKSCKDFAFSGDDTSMTVLDKSGNIRFWNIKAVMSAAQSNQKTKIELKDEVLMFKATIPSDKISPCSIMFIDKERPCLKSIALRYLLVGFRQNHLLQLWDIALGKPVQEIHLPHDSDSDAICSVSYNPRTGIIAVGHPTRNSIYFIHLSAPKYSLPIMSQSEFIEMVSGNNSESIRPSSTAIMSGVRELSMSNKGQIRSVDMLVNPASTDSSKKGETPLFELYIMHSTGVTFLSIKNADLGWAPDNVVNNSEDAESSGIAKVEPLIHDVEESTTANKQVTDQKEAVVSTTEMPVGMESIVQKHTAGLLPPSRVSSSNRASSMFLPEAVVSNTIANAGGLTIVPSIEIPKPHHHAKHLDMNSHNTNPVQPANGVAKHSSHSLDLEFEKLHKRISDDRRVQDAAANARQDAILKLVSSTLTDNVEKSLSRIISTSIQDEVLPAVSDVFAAMVERRLVENLHETLTNIVPREVRDALPVALAAALKDQETLRMLAEPLADNLTPILAQIVNTMLPGVSQNMTATLQQHQSDRDAIIAKHRRDDLARIDHLTKVVTTMSEAMMITTNSVKGLEDQITLLQKQGSINSNTVDTNNIKEEDVTINDEELENITKFMTEGKFEDATIRVCLYLPICRDNSNTNYNLVDSINTSG